MVRIAAKTRGMLDILVVVFTDFGHRFIVWPDENVIIIQDAYSSFVKRFLTMSHVSYNNIDIEDLEQ